MMMIILMMMMRMMMMMMMMMIIIIIIIIIIDIFINLNSNVLHISKRFCDEIHSLHNLDLLRHILSFLLVSNFANY
jgi:hypothetical protein